MQKLFRKTLPHVTTEERLQNDEEIFSILLTKNKLKFTKIPASLYSLQ